MASSRLLCGLARSLRRDCVRYASLATCVRPAMIFPPVLHHDFRYNYSLKQDSNVPGPSESHEKESNVSNEKEPDPESNEKEPEKPSNEEPNNQEPTNGESVPETSKPHSVNPSSSTSSITPPPPPGGAGSGGPADNDDDKKSRGKIPLPETDTIGSYPPLLALSMKSRPPLPGTNTGITVTDPAVIKAFHDMKLTRDPYFVLFHVKDSDALDTDCIVSQESVHQVGVLCQVSRYVMRKTLLDVVVYPHKRVSLETLIPAKTNAESALAVKASTDLHSFEGNMVSTAITKPLQDEPYDKESVQIKVLVGAVKELLATLAKTQPVALLGVLRVSEVLDDPANLADCLAAMVHSTPERFQQILESANVEQRLRLAIEIFKVEVEASITKSEIIREVHSKVEKQASDAYLKDYMRELQKRIGGDPKAKKTDKFEKRLSKLKMTEEALEAYNNEISKQSSQSEHSGEASVSEKYLDWLTSIPWGITSRDRFNILEAQKVLDRDHYGLKDVKERILEFISVGKISGKIDGKILCLEGPPGTGKTSIARAIAESLNRRYVRIAVGGVHDVSEVKGFKRTYVGSVPGRIISALKEAKTMNPLILIDEIDKLNLSRGSAASSAFLEILDPEQNNAFVDHYIDVKVDLSKVLFVCTANYLENIPAPLRDRMEIINVSGYTRNEKVKIATKHLIPTAAKKAGLDMGKVQLSDSAIDKLIDKYSRESGLRSVKRFINRIFSKAAMKIVQEVELREEKESVKEESVKEEIVKEASVKEESVKEESSLENTDKESQADEDAPIAVKIPEDIKIEVTSENLKEFAGPEVVSDSLKYKSPPPGVVTGLAYTSYGGEALYIESILVNLIRSGTSNAGIRVTGSLKDVMKESASIAYSVAKLYMNTNLPENRFFEAAEVHVHCPEGSIPKDGPSAGIAFTSSLMSLALNEPVPSNIAMTGEITVTGRVLKVGGLKEKILGARRNGCDTIIFPQDIQPDLDEVSDEVKGDVTFVPVTDYQQVFDTIFPNLDRDAARKVWAQEFTALDEKRLAGKQKKVK